MEAVLGEGELSRPEGPPRSPATTRRGSAAELHGFDPEGTHREAWWLEVDRPALVLGSTQRLESADAGACAAAGFDVVRRRSGGGAVLMVPGEIMWLDVVVPRHDPVWDDDVGRSMWWLGEAWATALRSVGVDGVEVHRGPMVQSAWSRLICFDGLGPGEVTVGGAKAVGISQRRTRDWARLQSALHLRWRPDLLLGLLAPPVPPLADLGRVWSLPPPSAGELHARVTAAVARSATA